jgi:hypothetical protein
MANTGYKGWAQLLKVTDDVNEFPLDAGNALVSITSNPQDSKINNIGDPDYVAPVWAPDDCPPDPVVVEYRLYGTGSVRGDACSITTPLFGQPITVYAATANPLLVAQFFNDNLLVGPWTAAPNPGDYISFSTATDTATKYTGVVDATGNVLSIVAC